MVSYLLRKRESRSTLSTCLSLYERRYIQKNLNHQWIYKNTKNNEYLLGKLMYTIYTQDSEAFEVYSG